MALLVDQQLVATCPEAASALPWFDFARRADVGPVEITRLPAIDFQRVPLRDRFFPVAGGEVRRVEELPSGEHLQAACATHDHQALDAGKILVRVDLEDPHTARTLEETARAVTASARARLPIMLEPFMSRRADGRVIGQNVFHMERSAPTPDAGGAAMCLATVVNLESDQIVEWMSAVVAGGSPGVAMAP